MELKKKLMAAGLVFFAIHFTWAKSASIKINLDVTRKSSRASIGTQSIDVSPGTPSRGIKLKLEKELKGYSMNLSVDPANVNGQSGFLHFEGEILDTIGKPVAYFNLTIPQESFSVGVGMNVQSTPKNDFVFTISRMNFSKTEKQ